MQPEGLRYEPGFVSAKEEAKLLSAIDAAPWLSDLKRRVQHYGWRYDYRARRVRAEDRLGPLPGWLGGIAARLCENGLFPAPPDQAIVNEYLPGQGIAPHVDCEPCFGPIIASLSLGSGCEMRFDALATGARTALRLKRQSLLVLSGPARYEWRHGIPARKSDPASQGRASRDRRVSITFRTIRK